MDHCNLQTWSIFFFKLNSVQNDVITECWKILFRVKWCSYSNIQEYSVFRDCESQYLFLLNSRLKTMHYTIKRILTTHKWTSGSNIKNHRIAMKQKINAKIKTHTYKWYFGFSFVNILLLLIDNKILNV